jgi:hypothetical protein
MRMSLPAAARSRETANNVISLTKAKSAVPASRSEGKCDEVLIHVRFHPNGLVNTIDHCPENLSLQDWFYRLCYAAPANYQVFAGGRGVFRMQRSCFEAILSQDTK